MQTIGHNLIDFKPFNHISNDTNLNFENILLNYNERYIKSLKESKKDFSLIVENIKELLIANELGAKYIVVPKNLAKISQKIATEYLFDSKIALIIKSIDDIEELIKDEIFIDAVILPSAINYN